MTPEAISDFELGYNDKDERITFEDFTFILVADLEEVISKHGPNESSSLIHHSNQSHTSVNEKMKLPTINIPSFNGDIENWVPFI